MPARGIEYRPLSTLRPDPANPKDHAIELLTGSVGRFGYIEPIVEDGRTGYLISGHGRAETLDRMRAAGEAPPDGVEVDAQTGEWLVPVSVGWSSRSDAEAHAALVALNRTGEVGGWDDDSLIPILSALAATEGGLDGIGFTDDDVADLIQQVQDAEVGEQTGPVYSRKAGGIQYEPTMDSPPPVSSLVDSAKTEALTEQISAANLPADVRAFLLAGAQRHLVFDYSKIAEFYAHAEPEVQRLMEASALVIIDFKDAAEHGFVRLSERLTSLLDLDVEERERRDEEKSAAREEVPVDA